MLGELVIVVQQFSSVEVDVQCDHVLDVCMVPVSLQMPSPTPRLIPSQPQRWTTPVVATY